MVQAISLQIQCPKEFTDASDSLPIHCDENLGEQHGVANLAGPPAPLTELPAS